jgi:S1-C subfamily serine protease
MSTNNKKMIDEMLKPTVRVAQKGSGLVVFSEKGMTLVLTNAHVLEDDVEDDKNLENTPFIDVDRFRFDGRGKLIGFYRVQSEIVAFDRAGDLAMLQLRDELPEKHIVNLIDEKDIAKMSVFDDVFIVGCALSEPPVPTRGMVSSMNAEFDKKEYWMTTAPIVLGNSGGGCFKRHANGKYVLVGVPTAVSAMMEDDSKDAEDPENNLKNIFPHLNYMVPPYRMLKFVEYVKKALICQDGDDE